jgi:hypothetical protein
MMAQLSEITQLRNTGETLFTQWMPLKNAHSYGPGDFARGMGLELP